MWWWHAIVGFAGVHATLWALERGVDLALANKESLVAAGELALAARERGRGRTFPSTASTRRSFSVSRDASRSRSTPSCSPAPEAPSAAALFDVSFALGAFFAGMI